MCFLSRLCLCGGKEVLGEGCFFCFCPEHLCSNLVSAWREEVVGEFTVTTKVTV